MNEKINPEISTFGTSPPQSGSGWSIAVKQYDFDGASNNGTLYTNYYFYGKTTHVIRTNNRGVVDVMVSYINKATKKSVGSVKVSAGKAGTLTVTDLKKVDDYYVKFTASGRVDVYGYVK